jgi:hypothetical protein
VYISAIQKRVARKGAGLNVMLTMMMMMIIIKYTAPSAQRIDAVASARGQPVLFVQCQRFFIQTHILHATVVIN